MLDLIELGMTTREDVDAHKARAYVFDNGTAALFEPFASPATATVAARELLGEGAEFSHLRTGYPVYRLP